MSNSSLVNIVGISPNSSNPRNQPISKITIHHTAGVLSAETIVNIFIPSSRQASCNYGIGSDGRIALIVDESNRAWTSSSPANDNMAVTIEVSNSGGGPDWPVSDPVLNRLIDLCEDICRRNPGIGRLNYTGDSNGNLTRHNMFAATACPGPYLQSKFSYIADTVNSRLGLTSNIPSAPIHDNIVIGDIVDFAGGPHYSNASAPSPAAAGLRAGKAKVTNISISAPHPYSLVGSQAGMGDQNSNVYGWVDANLVSKPGAPSVQPGAPEDPLGWEVIINGRLYGNSSGGNPGSIISNRSTQCILYAPGAFAPYNFTGFLGWVEPASVTWVKGPYVITPPELAPIDPEPIPEIVDPVPTPEVIEPIPETIPEVVEPETVPDEPEITEPGIITPPVEPDFPVLEEPNPEIEAIFNPPAKKSIIEMLIAWIINLFRPRK